jgi:hypothetical protein
VGVAAPHQQQGSDGQHASETIAAK